jgi:large subunit ribosomal protein L18
MDKKSRRRKIRYGIRSKIKGSASKPRLAVFKSNTEIYAQLIDDVNGVTIANASSLSIKGGTKKDQASIVGKDLAEKAKSNNVEAVVFDRGGFIYHGRVKALADAAREAGLQF